MRKIDGHSIVKGNETQYAMLISDGDIVAEIHSTRRGPVIVTCAENVEVPLDLVNELYHRMME